MNNTFTSTVGGISSPEQINSLNGSQLVLLYNELTGNAIKKFSDHKNGLRRTLDAFQVWQDQQEGKPPKLADPEKHTAYRPGGNRGKIIELCNRAGGARYSELVILCKDWTPGEINAALERIQSYSGLVVTKSIDVDPIVVISGVLRTRKAFAFAPKKEQREHLPATKRSKVLDLLLSANGGTFQQVKDLTKWNDRTAYEGIRLIHSYLGYGLRETTDGRIFAFTA